MQWTSLERGHINTLHPDRCVTVGVFHNATWAIISQWLYDPGHFLASIQTIYLYRQSQFPKWRVGKCLIPVAQWLEQSACNREVVGSSPTRDELFSISENWDWLKSVTFKQSKNECYGPRMVIISCFKLYNQFILFFSVLHRCHIHHPEFPLNLYYLVVFLQQTSAVRYSHVSMCL